MGAQNCEPSRSFAFVADAAISAEQQGPAEQPAAHQILRVPARDLHQVPAQPAVRRLHQRALPRGHPAADPGLGLGLAPQSPRDPAPPARQEPAPRPHQKSEAQPVQRAAHQCHRGHHQKPLQVHHVPDRATHGHQLLLTPTRGT